MFDNGHNANASRYGLIDAGSNPARVAHAVGYGMARDNDTMEGDQMLPLTSRRFRTDAIDSVAGEVLGNLYTAVTGAEPRRLHAYQDDDALLLLLRFDPSLLSDASGEQFEPLIDISFMAMPDLVAEAVTDATGRTVMPGNLSICAERGLAVFAFSVLDDDENLGDDDDPFVMSGPLWDVPDDDDNDGPHLAS